MAHRWLQTGLVITGMWFATSGCVMAEPVAGELRVSDAWLDAKIADLASDELAARERAQIELAAAGGLTLDQIERALTSKQLPPEARQRLEAIGLDRFRRRDRAALGVSWQQQSFRLDGLEIAAPAKAKFGGEEFDSTKLLLPGDVIVKLDGQPVVVSADTQDNWDNCRALIMSHDPGDEVELLVLRDEQPMAMKLRMGRLADLDRPSVADPREILPRAWEYRLERRARGGENKAESVVVSAGLTEMDWVRLNDGVEQAQELAIQKAQNGEAIAAPGVKAEGGAGVITADAVQFFHAGIVDQGTIQLESTQKTLAMRMSELSQLKAQLQNLPDGAQRQAVLRRMSVVDNQVAELRKILTRLRSKPTAKPFVP